MTPSSPSQNETALHPQLSQTSGFISSYMECLISRPSDIIFFTFVIASVCLHLPLSVFILHQWKKCSASSSAPTSHADCFTFHLASMELVGVLGYVLTFGTICKVEMPGLLEVGILVFTYTWFGEVFFHILMCVEHYLAVVHPIVYLKLRNRRWIRIRNVVLGFVWLLCLFGVLLVKANFFIVTNYCMLVLSVSVVSFCNFSVLRVLMRPGPGQQGGARVDQSKRRAFFTILAILGTLVLRFAWGLFLVLLEVLRGSSDCIPMTIDVWFNLPSSLIVPLLFLLRTGKCECCKKNIQ